MAEFLWTFAVQEILKKAIHLAAEQLRLALGLNGELSKLHNSLIVVEAILRDVDKAKEKQESIRVWMAKLKNVAFEAEILLDELLYENLRRKVEIGRKEKVRNFFSISNSLVFRRNMACRIVRITEILRDVKDEASVVGLVSVGFTENESYLSQIRETDSVCDGFDIVGREDDILNIVNQIIDPSNQETRIYVLPIVGMGGIGKTTVAQSVFHHDLVKKYFEETIWVCVSENFDIKKILRMILESLMKSSSNVESNDVILRMLEKALEGKRYFLVLDDVWNEDPHLWSALMVCLSKITRTFGNNILVTSRSDAVANLMETLPRYHLGKLSDNQSWSIFKQRAFPKGLSTTLDLDVVGIKVARKFGGIPLVAKVLGGAMRFGAENETWLSIVYDLVKNPLQKDDEILSVLKLSVDHLPSSCLKQCFVYCSKFPKGYEFKREQLVQLWMAEGFIQTSEAQCASMEDIGEKYFNILLDRSLFEVTSKDENGRTSYCKMHDIVHDLACAILKSETLELDDAHIKQISLVGTSKASLFSENSARRLRTLNFNMPHDQITDFVCLRVLILDGRDVKNLPRSIGILKHLRYLDISYTRITTLPESIAMLYNLQTLKFGYHQKDLPKKLSRLISLRHLEFPINDDTTKRTPPYLGQLVHLQTLPCFVVGLDKGCQIDELGYLNSLRGKLELYNLELVKNRKEAMAANLRDKENLCQLKLIWGYEREDGNYNDLDVLEGLQPHKNLQYLNVENFKGEFLPPEIFVENLVKISLQNCGRCTKLPMLGQLPNLKALEISRLNIKCIGNEFYGNDHHDKSLFPKLKRFTLSFLVNLELWEEAIVVAKGTVFPFLEELKISNCQKLKSVPNHFASPQQLGIYGVNCPQSLPTTRPLRLLTIQNCENLTGLPDGLHNLSYLEKLTIHYCSKLKSFPSIQGLTNLRKLSINHCNELMTLPDGLSSCSSIKYLRISDCPNLNAVPDLRNMRNLSDLNISEFQQLPKGLDHATNLELLLISGCINQYDFSPLIHLHSLKTLRLSDWGSTNSLPRILEHLTGIKRLAICGFNAIETLPDWLGNVTSLEHLWFIDCQNLRYLPSNEAVQRLTKLSYLETQGCPKLKLGPDNQERAKILHVKVIIEQ